MECPKCTKAFNHKGKFKKHLMSHEQLKPHKCPLCGVGLSAEWVLKRHLETKHSGVKPYTCFQCNVDFTSKDHLYRHLNTRKHIPFVCEKCNKQYLRINAFNLHRCSGDVIAEEKTIENQEKKKEIIEVEGKKEKEGKKEPEIWMCPHSICEKIYSTRFNLRTHIRTAHEKVGFTCENCKCVILHKHSFKKHLVLCKKNLEICKENLEICSF